MKGKMRIIAFAMAVMMVFTTIVNDTTLLTVNASDLEQTTVDNIADSGNEVEAEGDMEGADETDAQDNSTEDSTGSEEDTDAEDASEDASEDTDSEDTDSEDTDSEDTDELSAGLDAVVTDEELATELAAFEQSIDMGDMIVHIYAAAGVLPEGVKVDVKALSDTQATTAQETVEGLLPEEVEVVDTYSYDITFSTEEAGEVQPAGYVEVTFEEVNKTADADVSVFHMDEDLLGATQVDASVASPDATVTDVAINASSFSVYTVTITNAAKNGNVTFDMKVGDIKYVKDILNTYFTYNVYDFKNIYISSGADKIDLLNSSNKNTAKITVLKAGYTEISLKCRPTQADSFSNLTISIRIVTGYNVSFDSQGATGTAPAALTIPSGTTMATKLGATDATALLSGAGLTKTNYTFGGWYTSNSFASANLFTADTVVTKDTTLYANWIKLNTVSFDKSGATGTTPATQKIPTGSTLSEVMGVAAATTLLSGAGLVNGSLVFGGWYTSTTYTDANLFTIDTEVTANTTLHAFWTTGYSVSFYLDGGTGGPSTQTVFANGKVSSAVLAQQPTLSGATFAGWKYFTPKNGGTEINDGSLTTFDSNTAVTMNTIVYATWTVTSSDTAAAIPTNGGSADAGKVTASKTAEWTDFDNGIAKVSFDLSGIPFATGSDIVIVMDASFSMYQQVNSYYSSGSTNVDRMAPAKAATVALVNKLLENGNAANNRVAFVPFADSIQSGYLNFQTDAAKLTTNVLGTVGSSGTDYAEALQKAKTYITGRGTTSRPAYVIFMSDGIDNRSGTTSQTVAQELDNLNVTIFPIGIQLPEAEATTIKLLAVNKSYVNVSQLSDLTSILSGVTEEIKVAGTDAIIKDVISDKFTFYNATGYAPSAGIACTDGTNVTITIGDITAANKVFSFYVQVKPGVTVSGDVKTNASAELSYKNADAVTQTITDTTSPGLQKPEIPLVNGTVTVEYYRVDEAGNYIDASGNSVAKAAALIKTVVTNDITIANGGTNQAVNADFSLSELADYEIYSGDIATKSVFLKRSAPTAAVSFNVEYATKYDLTITADTDSQTYNGQALTDNHFTIAGLQTGHTVFSSNISVTGTITNVGSVDNVVTVKSIVIKNAAGVDVTRRYNINKINGKLNVTAKAVTVSAIQNSKVYGSGDPTLLGTITGVVNGEKLTVSYERASGENAGTYVITPKVTLNSNYNIAINSANFVITKKAATLTVEDKTKVYGSTDPDFTSKITGLVGSDTISGIKYTRTTGNDVGSYTINATHTINPNYNITVVAGKLTITRKTATLKVDNKTKVYGEKDPSFTSNVSGLLDGESITGIKYTRVVGENVGSYTINATYTTNTNYNVTVVSGNLTITQKAVTLTVDNKTKEYGSADPTFTSKATGMVRSETISGITYSRQSGKNVGDYTINASYGSNPNYAITVVPGKLRITQKAVTLTVDNKTKVYGSADPTFTSVATGLVEGDSISGITYSRQSGNNVGDYTINASHGANPNYAITVVPGKLNITQKAVSLKVDNKTKVYGSADPAFTSTATGMVGSETISGITYSRQSGNSVGDYTINASYGSNPNYAITVVPGKLSITKKAVTLTVDNKTKVYGSTDPTFTSTAAGMVGSETISGITYSRQSGNNVGDYTINASYGLNPNYAITVVPGKLSITQKAVTLTVDNKTKVYGSTDPTFTSVATGLVESDSISGITYSRQSGKNVGDYTINASYGSNPNYAITVVPGKLSITQKAVTLAVDNKTKVYGSADPTFTSVATGMVGSETISGITYSRQSGNNVGDYTINASYGSNPNYAITVVPGKLSITKKSATITATPANKTYGDADPTLTGTVEGVVSGDNLNVSYTRESGNTVGDYTITPSYTKNDNYDVTVNTAKFSITAKTVYYTVDPATKKFHEEDPDFTGSFAEGSLVYGDEISAKFSREEGENVGEYDIYASLSNPNYTIEVQSGVLTITKADAYATIEAAGFTKTYDGIYQMLEEATASDDRETTYDISYLVDGEIYEGEGLPEFKNVKFDENGKVVPYIVTVVAKNSNYKDAKLDVEVLINQKSLTFTAITIAKLFSGDALTGDYASITAGSLAANQFVKAIKVTGRLTAVGSGSNVPSNAVIVDAQQEDVTANYAINYVNGLLTLYAQLPETPVVPVIIEEPLTPLAPIFPVVVRKITPVTPSVEEVEEEEATIIEEEETPLAPAIEAEEEIVPTEIEDEEVPLAVLSHGDCWIHWLILALSLIYAVYAVVRAMQRSRKIKELTDGAYDKNASTQA